MKAPGPMYSTDFGTIIFDDVRQPSKAPSEMFFNFLLNSITSSELSAKALQPIVCKFSGHLNFTIFASRKASEQIVVSLSLSLIFSISAPEKAPLSIKVKFLSSIFLVCNLLKA